MNLRIKRLNKDAQLPVRGTKGSGYYDVFASQDTLVSIINMYSITKVSTGLAFEIPREYILDIRPRGSLSSKGIIIANSPGTLDSDYRGELFILLLNLSHANYQINKGDRIAQINIQKVYNLSFTEVGELTETKRGTGAFGSTGR